jgi:NADH:ubiquinone oxidoreductase subunit 4 (subunit M)
MLTLNALIILAILSIITQKYIYQIALTYSTIILFYSIALILHIHPNITNLVENQSGISDSLSIGLNYTLGLDGISLLFICLSTLLNTICILSATSIKYRKRLFFILLFLTELALVNVFAVTEIFYFYIFFEAVLIPMFLIIGIYGSRQEKISAAYHFFLYTLLGSLVFLLSIIYIVRITGSTNIAIIKSFQFSKSLELFFWLAFFTSFSAKIPMFPLHIWSPKAHVEAQQQVVFY